MINITDQPININEVMAAATDTTAGAVNLFIGTVRDNALSKKVVRLEYEAYEEMAIAETQKIFEEATSKWGIIRWAIAHRTGILKPGEIAVAVAVATKHRKESFEASQFIMNELKEKVPIFKKEVFEDGEEWVSAKL
ncbi:MAG: molybdenum cofactor biosynthesis protein MoaE [Azospira oryzae]|nr:MAG: molybdenum cofactor biosynthesis protein MoaE [Azospira oryzae]